MAESSVPHPIAAIVVAALAVSGMGYAAYHAFAVKPREVAPLEQALFGPYFQELASGHADQARERFSTRHYQELFPDGVYRAHWAETFSRLGPITKRELLVANDAYELASRRSYISVKYQLTFERGRALIVYEIVTDAQGTPHIDWAGQHQPASSLTSPEPW